jgi:hypothetical protein
MLGGSMKQRFIRPDAELDDDAIIVLRGGALDRELLRIDAMRNYAVYNVYGVSVFAVLDASIDELSQIPPLVRFAVLTIVQVGDLRTAGLRLEATGRNPRHYDIGFEDLDEGIAKLVECNHRTVDNVYFEGEP